MIREFTSADIPQMTELWNSIVDKGEAFPQEELLTYSSAADFFGSQSFTAVSDNDGEIAGLYILHPNNIGRCGHIANASYAVKDDKRGQHIGEQLVTHSLHKCKELGFSILQFNAVVATNHAALRLYEKLGFKQLGIIPHGFRKNDGSYEDIIPHCFDINKL